MPKTAVVPIPTVAVAVAEVATVAATDHHVMVSPVVRSAVIQRHVVRKMIGASSSRVAMIMLSSRTKNLISQKKDGLEEDRKRNKTFNFHNTKRGCVKIDMPSFYVVLSALY